MRIWPLKLTLVDILNESVNWILLAGEQGDHSIWKMSEMKYPVDRMYAFVLHVLLIYCWVVFCLTSLLSGVYSRTFGDSWCKTFQKLDALNVTQPTVSKHQSIEGVNIQPLLRWNGERLTGQCCRPPSHSQWQHSCLPGQCCGVADTTDASAQWSAINTSQQFHGKCKQQVKTNCRNMCLSEHTIELTIMRS